MRLGTCNRGHALTEESTYADGGCKKCVKLNRRRRTERDRFKKHHPPEFVPGLQLLRKRRGFTLKEVAFEARMDVGIYQALEDCAAKATYEDRLTIREAITVLTNEREESMEVEEEKRRRIVAAGL